MSVRPSTLRLTDAAPCPQVGDQLGDMSRSSGTGSASIKMSVSTERARGGGLEGGFR